MTISLRSILRIGALVIAAGLVAGVLTYAWMSRQPEEYRAAATVIALDDIRTPQESIQYLADIDGALRAFPVRSSISEITGLPVPRLVEGLAISRVGSSSTLRLAYDTPSNDPDKAAEVLEVAAQEANSYLTNARDRQILADLEKAQRDFDAATAARQTAEDELAAFFVENGEQDYERLALIEERVTIDLRVRVVSAESDAISASQEAARLRGAADAVPTDLDAELAAVNAEVRAADLARLAEAVADEVDRAQASFEELNVLASRQADLRAVVDESQAVVDQANGQFVRAQDTSDSARPSFAIESNGPLRELRRGADTKVRAGVAGLSAAGLALLFALWWRAAVTRPKDER